MTKKMSTNRRHFIKAAALTAPGMAFIGSSKDIPGINDLKDPDRVISDRRLDNGWINARDCGASGSKFETTASATSGSRQIMVADAGDFKVGQGVMVSKCNIHYEKVRMWGTGLPYFNSKPVENSFEMRGYDGSAGSWKVYVVDIAPSSKPAFRWTDDLGRTWHSEVPVTHGWQPLDGGIEIKLNQRDWESGYVIAFGARDQLISKIEKIEGNVLTLQDEANRTVNDAIIRHNDTFALQEAINRGLNEKLNVFVPVGHYRLAQTILVNNPNAITIEGASSEDTVLDISEGEGSCLNLIDGTEVIIRNFKMTGFMGFDERDKAGYLNTRGSVHIWGFGLMHCNGISINHTERVLVENCHASRMSGECFVARSRTRAAAKPGQSYTQGVTYLRCSVTNSGRNAFNDTQCGNEFTSVLNCRIVDVGGCAWESASRFVKFIGNYVRNAGTVAIGNLGNENRDKSYPDLGSGQHVIADNVFESNVPYGGCAIRSTRGASQVIIRNNLFINFDSSAVEVLSYYIVNEYPSSNTTITGNIFDMTCIGQKSSPRTAILVNCNDTIVSDNQIYVRGKADPLITAIRLREPALNVIMHNNLIRNCGVGIITQRGSSRVDEVIDDRTFSRADGNADLPLPRIEPETVKGWTLVWRGSTDSTSRSGMSVIESFNTETLYFRLHEPYLMKKGDRFEIIAPSLNWNMHDNIVTDCLRPVVLDSYGSRTSLFKANMVTRGNTEKVPIGIEVHGNFQLVDNRIVDFNEDKATAMVLYPDAIGRPLKNQYQGNIFDNCCEVIKVSQPDLWKNSLTRDNIAIECVQKIPK